MKKKTKVIIMIVVLALVGFNSWHFISDQNHNVFCYFGLTLQIIGVVVFTFARCHTLLKNKIFKLDNDTP